MFGICLAGDAVASTSDTFPQREPSQVAGAIRAVTSDKAAIPTELKMQVRGCAFLPSISWSTSNAIKTSPFHACDVVVA